MGTFRWIGPGSGLWQDAANWDASGAIPGAGDVVTFASSLSATQVVGGLGAAGAVVFGGDNALTGTLSVAGALTSLSDPILVTGATLELLAGAVVSAATAVLGGVTQIDGAGALFTLGTLTLGGTIATGPVFGRFEVLDGATVQATTLTTDGYGGEIVVGPTSRVDVGGTSGAAGALTVEQGATVDLPAELQIGGLVVDNGLIRTADLVLSPSSPTNYTFDSTLTGSGVVEVTAGGTASIQDAVGAGGLRFQVDTRGTLTLDAAVSAATSIDVGGTNAVLDVSFDESAMAATISGFGGTDALVVDGTADSVGWVAGTAGAAGTLTVSAANGAPQSFLLAGQPAGRAFAVLAIDGLHSEVIVAAQPGAGIVAPGTSLADAYAWAGPLSGDWATAANWTDLATGTTAAVAAGSLDTVAFTGSGEVLQVIKGDGRAAAMTATGHFDVTGSLDLGSLRANLIGDRSQGGLTIDALGSVSAVTAQLGGRNQVRGMLSVGTLTLGGTIDAAVGGGSVDTWTYVAGGGSLRLSSLMSAGAYGGVLLVDATSTVDVGGTSGAAGAFTVERGATLSTAALLGISAPTLVIDGTMVGQQLELLALAGFIEGGGTIEGTGTIEAAAGGYADLVGTVAAGSLVIQVDSGATLSSQDTVNAQIRLLGTGDLLDITAAITAPVSGFASGDTLLFERGTSVVVASDAGGTVLTEMAGTQTLGMLDLAGDYRGRAFVQASGTHGLAVTLDAPCFAAGTAIATPDGTRLVETLRAGDRISTASRAEAEVVWVGHRTVDCARHPRPWNVRPVRVRAHAFAPGRPLRDLVLSPDHAVSLDGVLIPVRYLLNGASIVQEAVARVDYWHVELATHDVLLAEALPCESYLDTGNRAAFGGGALVAAHPDFARATWAAKGCAPLATGGAAVREARAALVAQLPVLGFEVTDDPALAAFVDGTEIALREAEGRLHLRMPRAARELRLRSRVAAPADLDPASGDTRRLGVAVAAVRFDGVAVLLDDGRLSSGWHAPEPELRWTDGAAIIRLDGAVRVDLVVIPGLLRFTVAPRTDQHRLSGDRLGHYR